MHYAGRKLVYLQIFEFIGATVSEFRFFMRSSNVGLITSELKGLTKKLSFSIPSSNIASLFFNQLLHHNVWPALYNVLLGLMTSV